MKNNFFAILLSLIISIGCTQETVINANIDEKLNNSGPTLKVQIKTENSRTIRPEVTKWEIKLFESNEQLTTRVLHGKDNTVTTFTNITTTEYKIKVFGYAVENDKDCKILYGEEVVKITANEIKMCVVTVNDNFEAESSENPNGTLSVNISGLTALGLDELVKENSNFTLKMSGLTNPNNPQTVTLSYKDGVLSGVGDNILSGSYKIENISFVHTDVLPTEESGDSAAIDVLPINLIQDPIVNIYPGVTTEINWVWNVIEDTVDEITQNNILKNTLVPVWNKPVVLNPDYSEKPSVPAKTGYLSANALFAEPTWDEEKTYMFTVEVSDSTSPTVGDPINYSASIQASELEFINCTYDESGDLWVLSGTSETKYFSGEGDSGYERRYCYVLKNVSTSDEYNAATTDEYTDYEKILKDFAVATVGEQNKQKYLFCITDTEDGNNIKSFKIEDGDNWDIENGTQHFTFGQISAIYAKDNYLYIAVTDNGNGNTTIKILKSELKFDENTGALETLSERGDEVLSLSINDFVNSYTFQSQAFAISDMYINDSKLYITAGCVCYQGNAWNNQQGGGVYHSFGGLFVYNVKEDGSLEFSNKYGIYEDNNENNPFLKEAETAGGGVFELEENIMQAETADSPYFAGPRYIIPAGKDLLIVDSGFYGVYFGEIKGLINCEKRNRIFTYNITENGLSFNSITKVDDSISFDYDYLVNSDGAE